VNRNPLIVAATLAGALAVLLLPDGEPRAWWFRGYVSAVAIVAARAVVAWRERTLAAPDPAALQPPRRRWLPRRTNERAATSPTERLLELASVSAGDAHRSLRPLLQEIAEERLLAHHGVSLADDAAATLVRPATWELLRPDRPPPHDLRNAGLAPQEIESILTELEQL
jgi:hypothetical protein